MNIFVKLAATGGVFFAVVLLFALFRDEQAIGQNEMDAMLDAWKSRQELFYRGELDFEQLDGWWSCEVGLNAEPWLDDAILALRDHSFMLSNGVCRLAFDGESFNNGLPPLQCKFFDDDNMPLGTRVHDNFTLDGFGEHLKNAVHLWRYGVSIGGSYIGERYFSVWLYVGKDEDGIFLWHPVFKHADKLPVPQDGIFIFRKVKSNRLRPNSHSPKRIPANKLVNTRYCVNAMRNDDMTW